MGSRCEVSLAEEREGLCWHQVNVGVRTLTGPKPLEWRLVAVFAAFVAQLSIDSIPPHTESPPVSPMCQPLDTRTQV